MDIEEDALYARPNMVQAWVSNVDPDLVSKIIGEETRKRWNDLVTQLKHLGFWNATTERELHYAAINWIGLTMQDTHDDKDNVYANGQQDFESKRRSKVLNAIYKK